MPQKTLLVEFDAVVMNGGAVLHEVLSAFMAEGVGRRKSVFDERVEEREFIGRDLVEAFAAYFAKVLSSRSAEECAALIFNRCVRRLDAGFAGSFGAGFKNFIRALLDADVRIIVMTRMSATVLRPALDAAFGEGTIEIYHDASSDFGAPSRSTLFKACARLRLVRARLQLLTASSAGVKAALLSGIGSIVVEDGRARNQDLSGADVVIPALNAPSARKILATLPQ